MAAATPYSNGFLLADTNTLAGPLWISTIKLVAGSADASLTLTSARSGTPVFYSAAALAKTQATDQEIDIFVPSGDTVTVALTGTGAKAYLYSAK